jgi:hypothetical protein
MTIQDLDRLVTKTNMTPASKRALKEVRRAVMTGGAIDPDVGAASWSIALDTLAGMPVRMSFSFKRE